MVSCVEAAVDIEGVLLILVVDDVDEVVVPAVLVISVGVPGVTVIVEYMVVALTVEGVLVVGVVVAENMVFLVVAGVVVGGGTGAVGVEVELISGSVKAHILYSKTVKKLIATKLK